MAQESSALAQEIIESFETWQEAWNRGDLETFLTSYWQSDKTRYISGNKMMMGFETIAESYRTRFLADDAPSMGKMRLQVEPEWVTQDEALVFGKYQALDSDAALAGQGVFTVHLRRIDGVWKIVSDHASALPKE
jgi:hypothetical protein